MKLQVVFLLLCSYYPFSNGITQDEERAPPNIKYPNYAHSIYKLDSAFTVNCTADGKPPPTYKWYRNGTLVPGSGPAVSADANTGVLRFTDFTAREEGEYVCYASNTFTGPAGVTTATSLSPPVQIRKIRLGSNAGEEVTTISGKEYEYLKIPCAKDTMTAVAEDVNQNWNFGKASAQINIDAENGRMYIDKEGSLHINYLLSRDSVLILLKCALGADKGNLITLGPPNNVVVQAATTPPRAPPQRQYKSEGTVAEVDQQSEKLECVFSGYDPAQPIPRITWTLDDGSSVGRFPNKYSVSQDGRALTIHNIVEQDERNYYCSAQNTAGPPTTPEAVFLNVTSKPIFLPNKQPADITVSQGKDAIIPCEARSASGETPPGPATWYINGVKTGSFTDRTKFEITANSLTIKSVRKPNDIMCVQCIVANSVGQVMGEACVNVLLPITLSKPPNQNQVIDKGHTIDLTVTATTDSSQTLNYKWTHFRNKSTTVGEDVKFTFLDPNTREAYINTTGLTDDEYDAVRGIYRCNISHLYDFLVVDILVTLEDKPAPEEPIVQSAGFDMWIIGLIIGILFLIIVIIIIIIVVCRKQQEGDYNVDKKETRAGLDPEKELKDKGFNEYSRPAFEDYDYPDKPPKVDLEYDDVPIGDDESLGEYGEEEDTHFNEDGSFIGIYDKKAPPKPPTNASESTI